MFITIHIKLFTVILSRPTREYWCMYINYDIFYYLRIFQLKCRSTQIKIYINLDTLNNLMLQV